MSVLQSIQNALSGIGFAVGAGEYPADTADPCGKIVFTGEDKPVRFMGQVAPLDIETFKVIVRGNSYGGLAVNAAAVKSRLVNAGFIQTGGYEDVEPKEGETFMQLAVSFKSVKEN